jgi:hypothetical protein
MDRPKSAALISCSVGVEEQLASAVAITIKHIFFMVTLSAVRLCSNNRRMKIRQQDLQE